jgi:hypothetical protein
MEIKVFSDMIDALEKAGRGFVALVDLSASERQRYREVLGETYSLLDSAIMLVVIRLGDLLQLSDQDRISFLEELRGLDNFKEWSRIERDVRLCSNLRAARRDMSTLGNRLRVQVAVGNSPDFRDLLDFVLESEGSLADFISNSLTKLAQLADEAQSGSRGYKRAVKAVHETRESLKMERQKLITSEIKFYSL